MLDVALAPSNRYKNHNLCCPYDNSIHPALPILFNNSSGGLGAPWCSIHSRSSSLRLCRMPRSSSFKTPLGALTRSRPPSNQSRTRSLCSSVINSAHVISLLLLFLDQHGAGCAPLSSISICSEAPQRPRSAREPYFW